MARYKKIGQPLTPWRVLEGRRKGEVFEADLDDATERALLAQGAITVVGKSAAKPEPKTETKIETPPSERKVEGEVRVSQPEFGSKVRKESR